MATISEATRWLSAFVVGIMILAACAPAAAPAPAPAPAAPKQPQAPAAAAAPQAPAVAPASAPKPAEQPAAKQPNRGGQLIMLQSRDAASLDPLACQVYTTCERISIVYPRLIIYTRVPGGGFPDTTVSPSYITEGWSFSNDGKTLTFKLKKGIKYQNLPPVNGREFIAKDVKFSIERYMTDPTSAFQNRYDDIASIETPDNYTVVFKLKRPSAFAMYALAAEPSFITPPEIKEKEGDYKQLLVGPGPFIHEKTVAGEGSTFKRNPGYIDTEHVYLDKFVMKVVTDRATRLAAFRAGQADFDPSGYDTRDKDALLKTNPDTKTEAVGIANSGFWFNMKNPLFQDLRVRKGLAKAIDLKEINGRIMGGYGRLQGPVPWGFGKWALSEQETQSFDAYKYDVAAAKKLLAEAGFTGSKTIQVYVAPKNISAVGSQIAEILQPVWEKELNIKFDIKTDEYSTFVNKCYNNKFQDVCIFGMRLFDPVDYVRAQYYTGGPRNGPGLDDPKVNAMINDVVGTLDEAQRQKRLLDVQRYINDNVLSMVHTPQEAVYYIYQPWLRNFEFRLAPPGVDWASNTWIDK